MTDKKLDEDESYWNETNISAGSKFIFDDDKAAALHQLGQTMQDYGRADSDTHSIGDSIDTEVVSWDGTKISTSEKSIRAEKPSIIPASEPAVRFSVASSTLDASYASFPASRRVGSELTPDSARRPASKSDVSSVGSGESADDLARSIASGSPAGKKEFSPADFSRLESEYKKLKLKFEHQKRDRYRAPDVSETIRRLLKGESVIFYMYKTKEDKISLLESALKSGDGNCIIAVLLFLKDTLSYSLFQEQLLRRPTAANHYVAYLRDHCKFDELVTTLYSLGRKEEAAMTEYRQACKKLNIAAKIASLKKALQTTFSSDASLNSEAAILTEYVSLLERQQPIDASDDTAAKSGKEAKFQRYPKQACLIDMPVLTTLYYCCLYHYDLPQNAFASPLSMRAHHSLTEKQYSWIAIKALCRQKRWGDIEKLLTSKGLLGLGGPRIKSLMPYDKLLENMERHGATNDVLSKYAVLIGDVEERYRTAKRYKCHQVAIDCLVNTKDRQELIHYRATLTPHTSEAYYAEAALQNSAYKWKN